MPSGAYLFVLRNSRWSMVLLILPTRRLVVIDKEADSGLEAGIDFNLAYSPERIDPGNPEWGLRNTPKIVGGLTPSCTERAVEFYAQIVDTVVPTVGLREAEFAKLLENTYRHINIALINEMAVFCHESGIDLWASIDAASTKPFGFQTFRPGPGIGGHCIPIDPNYLSWVAKRVGYRTYARLCGAAHTGCSQQVEEADERLTHRSRRCHLQGERERPTRDTGRATRRPPAENGCRRIVR